MAELEPEWDSEDSGHYHDGREQAEADLRDGAPYDDRAALGPRAWTEGYQDRWEEGDGSDGE